jgi:hypothetical protein
MANNNDNYVDLSESEHSTSDENVEITPVPIVKKKKGTSCKII